MCSREFRFQPNCFAESGVGFRQLFLLFQHGAKRVVSLGVIGLYFDRLLELHTRFLEFAFLPEENSQGVVRIG